MPDRRLRRIVYRIPTSPSAVPETQVQIILDSAPIAIEITPATTQHEVPIATRVTTLRRREPMEVE
jgi:hypothetical protein